MAIDNQALENELNNYGNVIICGENNIKSYIIVVENVITDVTTLKNLIDNYLNLEYPTIKDITLVDGVFKCLYVNY
jgi:hypothetical protein